MLYSKTTNSFYDPIINAGNIPSDAVEISDEVYNEVKSAAIYGKVLASDDRGHPVMQDPPPAPAPSREKVEAARLRAYANPLGGSDKFFAEVARLQAMGGSAKEIESIRSAGIDRYKEIQAENPWPADK